MSFEKKSIRDIVLGINNDEYLLPVIQREVVWSMEQIERLFESIYLKYPIGSLLFWEYEVKEPEEYSFYRFVKEINEYKKIYNEKFSLHGRTQKIIAVLDGQQRLTSLFLGLMGQAKVHIKNKKWDKEQNFEVKKLYINLLNKDNYESTDDIEEIHNKIIYKDNKGYFKFKTEEDVKNSNFSKDNLWFEIGKILDFKNASDYKKYIPNIKSYNDEQQDRIQNTINDLFLTFNKDEIINYYKEETQDLDKVLDIFVRTNSGGTKLSKSDFLMSVIANNWNNAKDKINEKISAINHDYNFELSQDVFLRGCLLLTNNNIVINVKNFKNKTIKDIENNFDNIIKYIRLSCEIFNNYGFNKNNLTSKIIIVILALYLKENDVNSNRDIDFDIVKKWIYLTILSGVLGGQTNAYLTDLRKIIQNNKGKFPLEEIKKMSKEKNKNMDIDRDMLLNIVDKAEYGTQYAWSLLLILYPNHNYQYTKFSEDHIFPYSKLSKEQLEKGGNFIPNLQLLEILDNQSKQDKVPEDWIKEYCNNDLGKIKEYKERNFIPMDLELTMNNFDLFIKKRKEIIINKIMEKL